MRTRNARILALMICALYWLPQGVQAQDRPNIVYLLVDNWGWGDIGVSREHRANAED